MGRLGLEYDSIVHLGLHLGFLKPVENPRTSKAWSWCTRNCSQSKKYIKYVLNVKKMHGKC